MPRSQSPDSLALVARSAATGGPSLIASMRS